MSWMPKSDKLYYTVTALTGNDVITLDPATPVSYTHLYQKELHGLTAQRKNNFTLSAG